MHHKRKRSSASSSFKERSSSDDGSKVGEPPARLRFQNHKPLCLQYNLGSNGYHKRMQCRLKRPNHRRSLVKWISPYLVVLYQWFINIHYKIVDFILEPAESLFIDDNNHPFFRSAHDHVNLVKNAKSYAKSLRSLSRKNSTQQRVLRYPVTRPPRRDYGRSARVSLYQERMSELCIPP